MTEPAATALGGNPVARALREGGRVCAAWAQLGSSASAEILAQAGFDMVVIDAEHSQTTLPGMADMMRALGQYGCFPMVRAPWNDMVWIKQILDAGAWGVHIPYVSTAEEARAAMRWCMYPPEGARGIAGSQRAVGYGLEKSAYYRSANREIIKMIAIETPEGVRNIREILNTPYLDGVFIGPADLSTSMGHLADPSHAEVRQAIAAVEKAVIGSGKFLGSVASGMEDAMEKYERGYNLLYVMSDTTCLSAAAAAAVKTFRARLGP